jgi:hypothetical protein
MRRRDTRRRRRLQQKPAFPSPGRASRGATLPLKRSQAREQLPPSRIATPGLCRYRRSCVATRRGSAVAFSLIHRAGVPVVGGLSRFHHFACRGARPNSSPPLVVDAINMRASIVKRKGAVEKRGGCGEGLWRVANTRVFLRVALLGAVAQGIDQQRERRRWLPAARVIEMVAGERRTPVFQNWYQPPFA